MSLGKDMKLPFAIDLNNKVAVVTGGGGVLCAELAAALAASGAKVAVLDLDMEAAEKTARALTLQLRPSDPI